MNIVILAAGQGKRMHSNLPKVLHPIAGKALVAHVIDTARSLAPQTLCLVYGHGGDAVRTTLAAPDLAWALQEPQLGTGHAVQQALPHLKDGGTTLVLYGDVPLIQAETLKRLLQAAQDALAILTVELADPSGYGRIVRNAKGEVVRIVEQKDSTPEERAIREINTGIMAMPTARLGEWLGRLSNDNAQKEYYLTDIVGMAVADGLPIHTANPKHAWEVLGVNSKVQLAELERVAQRNAAEQLMEGGVRLADPARFDVRGELVCGRDVFIDVNCVFEGKVVLDEAVEVGPNCVLRNAHIGAGTKLAAYTHIEDAVVGPDGRIGPFARLRPGRRAGRGRACRQLRRTQEQQGGRPVEGQSPCLHRRRRHRQPGKYWCRYHYLQLRWGQQVQDDHRGRCLHRFRYPVGCTGYRWPRRHTGRGHDLDQGRPARDADHLARPADIHPRLETATKSQEVI
jgi:bifunctional UDP-N-acetylglucosamine pyrophosphorylase/glucosamine-1-phosphate N-acetyltransferase